MGKNPQPARDINTKIPSIADMSARQQKPSRPQVHVNADNATLTVESLPHTPAEAIKVPNVAPPNIAVTTGFPGMTEEDAKEPKAGPDEGA